MSYKSANSPSERENIPERYKWKLEDIYESEYLWEEELEMVKHMLPMIKGYEGKLSESAEALLGCLRLRDEILRIIDKLYVYAHMRRDENNTDSKYQALADRAERISNEVDKEISFITPEIIRIPQETVSTFMEKDKDLKLYSHHIDEIMDMKKHILSTEQEIIVAMTGDICQIPENAYRMLVNADIKFPTVKSDKKQDIELSEARYYQFIRSENRKIRHEAFDKLHSTYKKYCNTFAAILNGAVKKDIFFSKVRNYSSALEASLDKDHIHTKVYDNVIETINNNLDPLHRYMEIKRRALNIGKVHMYDLYAPIVRNDGISIPYKKALNIIVDGLSPLGEKYTNLLLEAYDSRWIDVFESRGKTNGAYSWGSYDTHPYILLNYNSTFSDLFTIAHELGHSIHSYMTRREQPYVYSQYTLFTAEVASTTNEALLTHYLLKATVDRESKLRIISQFIESIRTTVYRQTMFAEFEKIIHEKIEKGQALTSEFLCALWYDLNVRYYGNEVTIDEDISVEWARVSHFYRNFYVYKYVTGYSAAISLSQKILKEGEHAVGRYFEFLKSGDSDYTINILKRAGVDMTTPEPIQNVIKLFEELLDELEKQL